MSEPVTDSAIKDEYRRELYGYLRGYLLAAVLTAIPFYFTAIHVLSRRSAALVIGGCAVVQIGVHFASFLHLGRRSSRDVLIMVISALLIMLIMIFGTIWIMFNLHARMALGG